MRATLELPRLSLAERDRRYAAVRKQMAARGLDAIVLWGWPMMWDFYTANARYLSPIGGNAEFNVLIFPAVGEPTSIIHMPTFLDGWHAAQDWVKDIRPRTKTWADSVASRIKELKLERGKIGMDGLAGPLDPDGWLPHDVYQQLTALLPDAGIVGLDDMLEKIRAIKSEEELGVLRKAAALGDLMLASCRDVARPGVKECEVYAAMMQTMMANGGEEPTLFLIPIHSGCRRPGRWKKAISSSVRCIRSSAATSRMWNGPTASASRSRNSSGFMRDASPPTGAGSSISVRARPFRPR